uniref:Uncharacterized protein LOC104227042 n=1 Tax=Nicotiana sylvestris TaxID=4096 RepID=A0A1U7WJM6_NICSY|nr:PREDICTED: uncharacterized protein LOC104227042 [Nicotiana sylvestris]
MEGYERRQTLVLPNRKTTMGGDKMSNGLIKSACDAQLDLFGTCKPAAHLANKSTQGKEHMRMHIEPQGENIFRRELLNPIRHLNAPSNPSLKLSRVWNNNCQINKKEH